DWSVTVVDKDNDHHYQPGYLFIPFWMDADRVVRDRRAQLDKGVEFVEAAIERVDNERRVVRLADGGEIAYDWLIIASGAHPRPDLVPGMADGKLWRDKVHDFYTYEGTR